MVKSNILMVLLLLVLLLAVVDWSNSYILGGPKLSFREGLIVLSFLLFLNGNLIIDLFAYQKQKEAYTRLPILSLICITLVDIAAINLLFFREFTLFNIQDCNSFSIGQETRWFESLKSRTKAVTQSV